MVENVNSFIPRAEDIVSDNFFNKDSNIHKVESIHKVNNMEALSEEDNVRIVAIMAMTSMVNVVAMMCREVLNDK